jgi:hypothetical protein
MNIKDRQFDVEELASRGQTKGRMVGQWIWPKYFISMYENRILKFVKSYEKQESCTRKNYSGGKFYEKTLHTCILDIC